MGTGNINTIQNHKMRYLTILLLLLSFSCKAQFINVIGGGSSSAGAEGYNLIWEDNFSGSELNPAKWDSIPEGGSDWDFYMSKSPLVFDMTGGSLYLKGILNPDTLSGEPRTFLCGGIWTKDIFDFQFGKIEIRASMESAGGAWPALWMLPTDWGHYGVYPKNGEIDIMEHVNDQAYIHQTAHSYWTLDLGEDDNPINTNTENVDVSVWNIYGLEWYSDSLVWTLNGTPTFTYPKQEELNVYQFPFDGYKLPFYIMVDMQLGGAWAGWPRKADLPVQMLIDYVKVYERTTDPLMDTLFLAATGDGTGVATLTLTVSQDITISLSGMARFYSDDAGTADQSTTWDVTTGAARTIYLRCPFASEAMTILETDAGYITSWGEWTSPTNAPSLGGSISQFTALTGITMGGNNTISGDFSSLPSLTFVSMGGSNTVSGSIAGLTGLTYFDLWDGSNTITGSVAALTSLTVLEIFGSNTLSGSIEGLTSLTFIQVTGSNTLTGDLSIISDGLTICNINPGQMVTYTAGGDWSSIGDQSNITVNPAGGYGLSSDEVDLFIIEVEDTRAVDRHLHITLTGSNAYRTEASTAAVTAIEGDGGTVTVNGVTEE